MTTLREAAEMALEALDSIYSPLHVREIDKVGKAINNLRIALEQPVHTEQPLEMVAPAAWIFTWYEIANDRYVRRIIDCEERPNIPGYDLIPLYTAPPKRKWQGLTDYEINNFDLPESGTVTIREFVRIIEAKLKEKNT